MSIFDGPLPTRRLSPEEKKRKQTRDARWRKASEVRRFWTAEEQEEERRRLQAEIDEILAAKRAA